jgi:hypothetical protein
VQRACYEIGEVFVLDPYRAPGMAGCTLSARFATELAGELEPGERVVWTGVPRRLALLRRVLGELWLPLLYNGFVVALVAMCGGRLSLAAVPLLTFGLPLFHGPLGAWSARKSMFYAVTDRRALVFDAEGLWAVSRADIVGVRVKAGDIALAVRKRGRTAMVGVPDARRVAEMLR